MKNKLNNDQKNKIIQLYLTGEISCNKIAKMYNVSHQAILKLLQKHNITINKNFSTEMGRRYSLNTEFFDNIDTEEKAYILGLLYADGYNSESRTCVNLTLQESDKEILEKINNIIKSNRPLLFIRAKSANHQHSWRLSLSSVKISKRLKDLGCPQGKSLILTFPTNDIMPEHLLQHFIRGYFDGDGSFYTYKHKNYIKYGLCIVSTEQFCLKLKEILLNTLKLTTIIEKRHKNRNTSTRQIRISGRKQIFIFLNWLYNNANIYLKRKYEKFMDAQNTFSLTKTVLCT